MTKSELIINLTERFPQFNIDDINAVVDALLKTISSALAKGQRVEARGFGVFSVTHRSPRQARNPKSGEKVMVQSKRVPHFKPGKDMRERVLAH